MQAGFNRIRMGSSNTWLLQGQHGYVLVDAGHLGRERSFLQQTSAMGVKPEQIRLIVLTHAHHDHAGSLAALKELCNCPVAVHAGEAHLVSEGEPGISPGTNLIGLAISSSVMQMIEAGQLRFTPTQPDILIRQELSLAEYGLDATVIPTPGHTHGSVSVLLPDGNAFVGDLMMRCPPLSFTPMPPFADNKADVYKSWRLLLKRGARAFWTGHGLPCRAEQVRAALHLAEILKFKRRCD